MRFLYVCVMLHVASMQRRIARRQCFHQRHAGSAWRTAGPKSPSTSSRIGDLLNNFSDGIATGALQSEGRHAAAPGGRARSLLLRVERVLIECHSGVKTDTDDALGFLIACAASGWTSVPDAALLVLYILVCSMSPGSGKLATRLLEILAMMGTGPRAMRLSLIENAILSTPSPPVAHAVAQAAIFNAPLRALATRVGVWLAVAGSGSRLIPAGDDASSSKQHTRAPRWAPWRKLSVDRHILYCLLAQNNAARGNPSPHRRVAMRDLLSAGVPNDPLVFAATFNGGGIDAFVSGASSASRRRALLFRRALMAHVDPCDLWASCSVWSDIYSALDAPARRLLIAQTTSTIERVSDIDRMIECFLPSSVTSSRAIDIEPLLAVPLAWRTLRHCSRVGSNSSTIPHEASSDGYPCADPVACCLRAVLPFIETASLLAFLRYAGGFELKYAFAVARRCSAHVWSTDAMGRALPVSQADRPISRVAAITLAVMLENGAASRTRDTVTKYLAQHVDDHDDAAQARTSIAAAAQRSQRIIDEGIIRDVLTGAVDPAEASLVARRLQCPVGPHHRRFTLIACMNCRVTPYDTGCPLWRRDEDEEPQRRLKLASLLRLLIAEGTVHPHRHLRGAPPLRNGIARTALQYVATSVEDWPRSSDTAAWDVAFADAARWEARCPATTRRSWSDRAKDIAQLPSVDSATVDACWSLVKDLRPGTRVDDEVIVGFCRFAAGVGLSEIVAAVLQRLETTVPPLCASTTIMQVRKADRVSRVLAGSLTPYV